MPSNASITSARPPLREQSRESVWCTVRHLDLYTGLEPAFGLAADLAGGSASPNKLRSPGSIGGG